MNIKSILISLALLISFNVYPQSKGKEISLDNIFIQRTFAAKSPQEFRSMMDGEHYSVFEDGAINMYSYRSGEKVKTIFDETIFNNELKKSSNLTILQSSNLNIDSYEFSPDESKILITTNTEMIYRHSFTAKFYIWDLKSQQLYSLSDKEKQRLATFSPSGDKVAFVYENNLYIKDLRSGNEEQITKDGRQGSIINGATDWVYEEELDLVKAFQWSPDGKMIAYYRFDESNVKEFSLTFYGELYPKQYKYKYPKPGESNSLVNVYIYNLADRSVKHIDTGTETDQYIPRIKWTNQPDIISFQRLNRHQNKLEILFADAKTGSSKVVYTEENKYYINVIDDIIFLKNNKQFIITSEKDGYNHLYLVDIPSVEMLHATSLQRTTSLQKTTSPQIPHLTPITKGKWDVEDFKGYDEKNNLVYFTSSETSPLERNVYSIKLNGESKKQLTIKKGNNDAAFSSNFNYYINSWSDANTPPYFSIKTSGGKELRVLESNSSLLDKISEFSFTKKEFFTFKTSEGFELNGWMMKPVNFDADKKYPVLMTVYGGPASQTVRDAWGGGDFAWYQMLCQKGYIIVSVDNRGTGCRGEEFRKCTYLNLGKYETDDQIEAAKYLGSLKYVDASRIGIWGWSFGGFMTTLCLTKGADYFKTGIAVAPVTNWRFYDNIYTERFMRTPQENKQGYDENSPINYASRLKGNLLIVHGLTDDNVHFQNSAEFVTALLKENKQFDTFYYPNKNHFINGGTTRLNLYTKITDYILKNL